MTLGERILQKRKECGLSQESLGEKLDVTRQTVYKWESDQAVPELDKLITLAQIFGVRVGWLIAEEKNDPDEQLAKLLAQSLALQPVRPDSGEIPEASASRKINRLPYLAAAAVMVIALAFSAVAFKLTSIDRKIADLQSTCQSQISISSQNEEKYTIADVATLSQPQQRPQVFTVQRELTVYSGPSKSAHLTKTVPRGKTVEVLRTDHVGAHVWSYIQYQEADGAELTGWIIKA